MLSRHFRAHNLNVSEMRLLFLCDARIQESLSEGVRVGGKARLPKNNRNNVFFKPSTNSTVIHGGSNIFQGGRGGSNISRGGGGHDAYFHKNAYNL